MKIKIINRKGEEICNGKYLYLERDSDKDGVQSFFVVFNRKGDDDSEIHFSGSKEEMKEFIESLKKEFEGE